MATVEVGMATWKAIRAPRPDKDLEIQDRIELDFKNEWLHLNIFGSDNAPFGGISSRLCTSPFLIMIEGVVASLPARGSPLSRLGLNFGCRLDLVCLAMTLVSIALNSIIGWTWVLLAMT